MIAFFDSGFGGLSIFREVEKSLPQYNYIYLADTLRAPYGGRSPENIKNFTRDAISYLRKYHNVKLIVLACHTASNVALHDLQEEFAADIRNNNWNILGVTIPLAEEAVELTKNNHIGVVGTRATIDSGAFTREITKINPNAKVKEQACPLLVPLIEEGWTQKPETKRILRQYLAPLKNANIDTLILGCTHYPLIMDLFERKIGNQTKVIQSGEVVARKLEYYLGRHPEIADQCPKAGERTFLTTDSPTRFMNLGETFYGKPLYDIQKIKLD